MELTQEEKSKYKSFEFILIDEIIKNGDKLPGDYYDVLTKNYRLSEKSKALEYFKNKKTIELNDEGYMITISLGTDAVLDYLKSNYSKQYAFFLDNMAKKGYQNKTDFYLIYRFRLLLSELRKRSGYFGIKKEDINNKINLVFDENEFINMDNVPKRKKDNSLSVKQMIIYNNIKLIIKDELYKNANRLSGKQIYKIIETLGYQEPKAIIKLLKNDNEFIRTSFDTKISYSLGFDSLYDQIKIHFSTEYNEFISKMTKKGYSIDVIETYITDRIKDILYIIEKNKKNPQIASKMNESIAYIFSEKNRFEIEAIAISNEKKQEKTRKRNIQYQR